MVYATRGLADALLDIAGRRDPGAVTVPLGVTPAGDLSDIDLDPETPVFTHFYLPDAGRSVRAVFGVDLGAPLRGTAGVFVSHPEGRLELLQTDDHREVVLVAVPPWEVDALAAFGRDAAPRRLDLLGVELPEESPP